MGCTAESASHGTLGLEEEGLGAATRIEVRGWSGAEGQREDEG